MTRARKSELDGPVLELGGRSSGAASERLGRKSACVARRGATWV